MGDGLELKSKWFFQNPREGKERERKEGIESAPPTRTHGGVCAKYEARGI